MDERKLATPIRRIRLHEQVARTLSLQIIRRKIEPLSLLPNEDSLCRQFDVSRTVIREAMRFMDAKGLVQVRPRIGTRVNESSQWALNDADLLRWQMESEPDIKFLRDLLELRMMIEPMAAASAARKATQGHIRYIEDALSDMADAKNLKDHIEADIRFHISVIEATGNDLVVSSLRPIIENTLGTGFRRFIVSKEAAKASLGVHEAVLDAIKNKDPKKATHAMRELLSVAARNIEETHPSPPRNYPQAAR